jgi:hypothetical protein
MSDTSEKEQAGTAGQSGAEPAAQPSNAPVIPGIRGPEGVGASALPGLRGLDSGPVAPPKGSGSISSMKAMPGLPAPKDPNAFDEEQERWLITKDDRMDYGPFSFREVKTQIERGSISAQHTMTDTDTNQKCRVVDHPLLTKLATEWTAKHMELERQMRAEAEQAKYNSSVVKILAGIFAVIVVAGAGVGVFLMTRPKVEPQKAVGPQFTDDPLKGMQIAMQPMPPPPPKKKKKVGPKNGAFDDSQSVNFEEGGDTLSPEDIQRTMTAKFSVLSGCLREEAARNSATKKIDLEFIVKGNGSVSSVRVNGSTSSPLASCTFAKMQSIQFPECKTCSKTVAAFSLTLK